VLPEVGLCIAFYDYLEVGDPYVYPAEGASHQLVKFRLGMLHRDDCAGD
jgi:DNA-directed RNA polymerase subunit E'/Rpb7